MADSGILYLAKGPDKRSESTKRGSSTSIMAANASASSASAAFNRNKCAPGYAPSTRSGKLAGKSSKAQTVAPREVLPITLVLGGGLELPSEAAREAEEASDLRSITASPQLLLAAAQRSSFCEKILSNCPTRGKKIAPTNTRVPAPTAQSASAGRIADLAAAAIDASASRISC